MCQWGRNPCELGSVFFGVGCCSSCPTTYQPYQNPCEFGLDTCWNNILNQFLGYPNCLHRFQKKLFSRGWHRTKHVIRATSKTMHFFIQRVIDNVSCFQHPYIFGDCHAQLRNKFSWENPFGWMTKHTRTETAAIFAPDWHHAVSSNICILNWCKATAKVRMYLWKTLVVKVFPWTWHAMLFNRPKKDSSVKVENNFNWFNLNRSMSWPVCNK